jgi:hypothetical protein
VAAPEYVPKETEEEKETIEEEKTDLPSTLLTSSNDAASEERLSTPPVPSTSPLYSVHIPTGVLPGQTFGVKLGDTTVAVVCPDGKKPGDALLFRLPELPSAAKLSYSLNELDQTAEGTLYELNAVSKEEESNPESFLMNFFSLPSQQVEEETLTAIIPEGVNSGESFEIELNGKRYQLIAPEGKQAGEEIKFQLPHQKRSLRG